MKAKDRTLARAQLHALVDSLPDPELHAARRFLEYLRGNWVPTLYETLAIAPPEDETEAERLAVDEARREVAAGKLSPHEDVRRRLISAD